MNTRKMLNEILTIFLEGFKSFAKDSAETMLPILKEFTDTWVNDFTDMDEIHGLIYTLLNHVVEPYPMELGDKVGETHLTRNCYILNHKVVILPPAGYEKEFDIEIKELNTPEITDRIRKQIAEHCGYQYSDIERFEKVGYPKDIWLRLGYIEYKPKALNQFPKLVEYKLIVEFLELPEKDGVYDFTNKFSDQNLYTIEGMKFHESWDWLMIVVRECFDVHHILPELTGAMNAIKQSLITGDINAAFKAVCEFINRYNKDCKEDQQDDCIYRECFNCGSGAVVYEKPAEAGLKGNYRCEDCNHKIAI